MTASLRGMLRDSGPSYIAGELAEHFEVDLIGHVRDAPLHPQTQSKIERCHRTMKVLPARRS